MSFNQIYFISFLHQHFDHFVGAVNEMLFHYKGLTILGRIPASHPCFPSLTVIYTCAELRWVSCTLCPDVGPGCSMWPWGPAARGSMLETDPFPGCLLTSVPWGEAGAELRNREVGSLLTTHLRVPVPCVNLSQGRTDLCVLLDALPCHDSRVCESMPRPELIHFFLAAVRQSPNASEHDI